MEERGGEQDIDRGAVIEGKVVGVFGEEAHGGHGKGGDKTSKRYFPFRFL